MKFLAFSDVHEDKDLVKKVEKRIKQDDIDFVIIPGDFTNFNRSLIPMLKLFNSWKKPVYIIPGNHEEGDKYKQAIQNYENLVDANHKAIELDNDYILLGYGGGGFTQQDPEFRKIARKWYGEYKNKKIILVTHGPPYSTKLDKLKAGHAGNIDYRKFIERIEPKLAISGHIHDTAGAVDKIKDTKLINPCWDGMVIELK